VFKAVGGTVYWIRQHSISFHQLQQSLGALTKADAQMGKAEGASIHHTGTTTTYPGSTCFRQYLPIRHEMHWQQKLRRIVVPASQ
jgi:hypothetical protein